MHPIASALSHTRELPSECEHHSTDAYLKEQLGSIGVVPPARKSRAEHVEQSVEPDKKNKPAGHVHDIDATQETGRSEHRTLSTEKRNQRYDAQRNYRCTVEEHERCENQEQGRHVCRAPSQGEKCTAADD